MLYDGKWMILAQNFELFKSFKFELIVRWKTFKLDADEIFFKWFNE